MDYMRERREGKKKKKEKGYGRCAFFSQTFIWIIDT